MSIIRMTRIPNQSEVGYNDCDRYSNSIDASPYLWNLQNSTNLDHNQRNQRYDHMYDTKVTKTGLAIIKPSQSIFLFYFEEECMNQLPTQKDPQTNSPCNNTTTIPALSSPKPSESSDTRSCRRTYQTPRLRIRLPTRINRTLHLQPTAQKLQ